MKKQLVFFMLFVALMLNAYSGTSQIITTIVGNGTIGYSGNGGLATLAQLYYTEGMAVDDSGNIFITDEYNNVVRKINTSGIISLFAGNGLAGFSGDGGPAILAQLSAPQSLAVDKLGNVFIADCSNNRIRKVNIDGTISTIAGNGYNAGIGGGFSGDGGPAISAEFYYPSGVAVDDSGNVYIADRYNQRIRKVNTTGIIITIAGTAVGGYNGDGGPAVSAELNMPWNVCLDGSGNIFVSDNFNRRVRKINPSGIITTVAGNGIAGFAGDGGSATSAELYLANVAVDDSGNIYIADEENQRIRKVNTAGIINTVAGTGYGTPGSVYGGYSGDGGLADSAELSGPDVVCVDANGNIYISDFNNFRIRKVTKVPDTIIMCSGMTAVLHNNLPAGSWFTSEPGVASVFSDTGIVTGIGQGSANIYYVIGIDTTATHIIVDSFPVVGVITGVDSVCPGDTIVLNDTVVGGTWSIRDTVLAHLLNPGTIIGIAPGYDTITYTVSNFACNSSVSQSVYIRTSAFCDERISTIISTGVEQNEVSPNPSTGSFTVTLPVIPSSSTIAVVDFCGRIIEIKQVPANTTNIDFHLHVSPGTYFLKVQNSGSCKVQKIILE